MKLVSLVLLLVLCFTLTFLDTKIVAAQDGQIIIRVDGSIEGTDRIERDGDIYTFTGDIYGIIKVERNFTVIDGAGHTLQGTGEEKGIDLSTLRPEEPLIVGVTVKNLKIKHFSSGIYSLNNNTFIGNYITDCETGINIIGGANNLITNNTFKNTVNPISIAYSGAHNITYNNFIDGTTILVWLSPTPNVSMNYWDDYNGTDDNGDGIGDTPYVYLNASYAQGIDNYPLVERAIIPEFFSWTILPIILTGLLVVTVYRKKLERQN